MHTQASITMIEFPFLYVRMRGYPFLWVMRPFGVLVTSVPVHAESLWIAFFRSLGPLPRSSSPATFLPLRKFWCFFHPFMLWCSPLWPLLCFKFLETLAYQAPYVCRLIVCVDHIFTLVLSCRIGRPACDAIVLP